MKTFIKIFFGIFGMLLFSCKTQPPVSIDHAKIYQISLEKNEYAVSKDSLQVSKMIWNKKDENCDAKFESDNARFCFQYQRKPQRQAVIKIEGSDEIVGTINNIKKYESQLSIKNESEYILKPIKGNLTVLKDEVPIARMTASKKRHTLEMSEANFDNVLLKSAILYKYAEYQKMMGTSDDNFFLLMILMGAI